MSDLLTAVEVAATLRVHPSTISRLVQSGALPAVRVGRRLLVDRADLDDFIGRQKAAVSAPTTGGEVFDFDAWYRRQRNELRGGQDAPRTKKAARRG